MKDSVVIGICGKPCSGKSFLVGSLTSNGKSIDIIDCDKISKTVFNDYRPQIKALLGVDTPKEVNEPTTEASEQPSKVQAVGRTQQPFVLHLALTEKEAATARLALAEFMWARFDRYQMMVQKGFKFSDGKEPTKEQIEKAWDQHKNAEALWHRLDAMRIPMQNPSRQTSAARKDG